MNDKSFNDLAPPVSEEASGQSAAANCPSSRPALDPSQSATTLGPLVSVLIPTFNRTDLLEHAIESVIGQSYQHIEIVVIDDASTEDIMTVCARQPRPIRYIRHDNNRGRAAAINTGLSECEGSFIAILDSDDYWLPHKIESQLRVFTDFPETGAVCGGAQFMDLTGKIFGHEKLPEKIIFYEKLVVSMRCMPGSNSNELVRRDVFDQVGMYDEGLRRAQDYEFWLRVARQFQIRGVADVLMYKRAHASERPDANIGTISACRRVIASRIPERRLRRKHKAWMWYRLYTLYSRAGQHTLALKSLLLSFLNYPLQVERGHQRLRPLLGEIKDKLARLRPRANG